MTSFQCEYCDCIIPQFDCEQQPDGKYECVDGKVRQFCCDQCHRDADEDLRVGMLEAREQFELYGADYDSWYR
jgi:hypothetical protein